MRIRIEKINDDKQDEIVIYCKEITPEIDAWVQQLKQKDPFRLTLSVHKGEKQVYLSLREILFFETDSGSVYAHTPDLSFFVRQRLYELENLLPPYFVRVSRSCIINTLHVYSIRKSISRVCQISFRHSHKEVYGSRLYSKELFKKMEERDLYENE